MCIYIYIYGCVYVGLWVCSWMGGQKGDLISSIFESAPECPDNLFFKSILARRPHKELCPRKTARLGEKDEESQIGMRPRSSQSETEVQSVGSETPVHEVKTVNTMARWVSIFGSCVGLSQSSIDGHENKCILVCLKMPEFIARVLQF